VCGPEAPYDLDRLSLVPAEDHRTNPRQYAFVITAEGAAWHGAQAEAVGDPDAYRHRQKANIGESLAAALRRLTGIESVSSELTYDLRSGEPDSLD